MKTFVYTEDVKEALYRAEKLVRQRSIKGNNSPLKDWELLLALFRTNRPFSRLDSLCRQIEVKTKDVIRKIELTEREITTGPEKTLDNAGSEESSTSPKDGVRNVFEAALVQTAQEIASQENPSRHIVHVDHLLKACCASTDPIVQTVLAQTGITLEDISTAQQRLQEKGLLNIPRNLFYSVLFFFREALEMVCIVLVLLIVIKEGLGELRLIPSESMLPGLQIGDRIVIEKMSRWWRPYQRQDILVFYPPEPYSKLHSDPLSLFLRSTGFSALFHNTEDDPVDKAYIKRLIGLPGDTVNVIPGQGVFVNGQWLDEPYVNEVAQSCTVASDLDPYVYCGPIKVPEGHYFMMGDNRQHSRDGRVFGFQPADRVVGRAFFRVLPIHRAGPLH